MGYSTLKAALDAVVRTNGQQQITGANLNGVMTTLLQGVEIPDRANPADTSGMNYVVLKSNKTFAEQVTARNTIYEIRDVFNGNGASVNVPDDCILFFNGGLLRNAEISLGDNTFIYSAKVKIFDSTIVHGCNVVCGEWFGMSPNNANNALDLVAAATGDARRNILISSGVYTFTSSVSLPFCSLIGEKKNYSTDNIGSLGTILNYTGTGNFISIEDNSGNNRGVFVKDIAIRTNAPIDSEHLVDFTNYGKIGFRYNSGNGGCYFENVLIYGFETGLQLSKLLNSKFDLCQIRDNGVGVSFINNGLISTSTRFVDCYFHGNATNFQSGDQSLVDIHFSGCIFESSKTENIVLSPVGLNVASFDNCYCERCNTLSSAEKTYIIKLRDVDDNGDKLTGEYHPVIQTHGCRWFGKNNAHPYFLYLPVGQYYSEGDYFATFTKLISIDDLRTENVLNSCGVIFLSYFRYYVSVIDEIDISAVSKNKIRIVANNDNFGDINKVSRKTIINGISIEEQSDYSGVRREIAIQDENQSVGASVTNDGILVVGDKNRRLGDIFNGTNGFSNGISLPTQTTQNSRPNGAKGDQVFIRGLKVGGRPFIGISSTLEAGDSVATAKWTNNILLHNSYGSTRPSPSAVSALTGFIHFDNPNGRPIWWTSAAWVDALGNPADAATSGTTAQRPANVKPGFFYFDTTLNKPIWATGSGWVDATGASV